MTTVELTSEALAKMVRDHALKDVFNDDARIVLSDFRQAVNMPELTAQEIIDAWKKHYSEPIEQRAPNVLIVHISRKSKR